MSDKKTYDLQQSALQLLKQLIAIPSYSKEEDKTADVIFSFLETHDVKANRHLNNVWATNKFFDTAKPTILLNSHHDTVKPNKGYSLDPFNPIEKDGKLYGLGSNDAGASLVSLVVTFLHFHDESNLKYNLILGATAEEEISGVNGIESLLPHLPPIQFGIVGEPTRMQMAIAERGLMVLDCVAKGKAGHAARDEGENALYKAIEDINTLQNTRFEKESELLGKITCTVTVIETENKAHNVVPGECRFVADVRVNELYSLEEILEIISTKLNSTVTPRSMRMRSTGIPLDHPIVQAGLRMSKTYYGSPTTSDKALMPFPSLKIGPGDSARSHTADEFVYLDEINIGIEDYIELLNSVL